LEADRSLEGTSFIGQGVNSGSNLVVKVENILHGLIPLRWDCIYLCTANCEVFGFWTSLYTFRVDQKKFWILPPLVTGPSSVMTFLEYVVGEQTKNSPSYIGIRGLFFAALLGSLLTALLVTATRPRDFFEGY
jgi:hypothetical protein